MTLCWPVTLARAMTASTPSLFKRYNRKSIQNLKSGLVFYGIIQLLYIELNVLHDKLILP